MPLKLNDTREKLKTQSVLNFFPPLYIVEKKIVTLFSDTLLQFKLHLLFNGNIPPDAARLRLSPYI